MIVVEEVGHLNSRLVLRGRKSEFGKATINRYISQKDFSKLLYSPKDLALYQQMINPGEHLWLTNLTIEVGTAMSRVTEALDTYAKDNNYSAIILLTPNADTDMYFTSIGFKQQGYLSSIDTYLYKRVVK